MQKINPRIAMLCCTAALTLAAYAQSPVRMTQRKAAAPQAAKSSGKASLNVPAIYYKSSRAIKEAFFPEAYAQELMDKDPLLKSRYEQSRQNSVPRSIARAEDNSDMLGFKDGYRFFGFNKTAGGIDEGGWSTTPGIEAFNIDPFNKETVASGKNFTENAFYANGKYYTFNPIYSSDGKKVTGVDCVAYDPLKWNVADSVRIKAQSFADVPYLSAYCEKNGLVYCVTCDDSKGYDAYYMNTLDLNTFTMKRLAYLGGYSGSGKNVGKRFVTPKSLSFGNGKLVLLDNAHYMYEVDLTSGDLKLLSTFSFPYCSDGYGMQPMIYDKENDAFLLNFYSLWTGTIYYKVSEDEDADEDNVYRVDSLCHPDRGYKYFFIRPDSIDVYGDRVKQPDDMKVTVDGTTATLDFTVPAVTEKGTKLTTSNVIATSVYVYVDNEWVSINPQIQRASHPGQKISVPLEDIEPGRHVVSVSCSMQLQYPYSTQIQSPRFESRVIYVGEDAPAEVGNPTATLDGKKIAISWDAPTEGENGQFGAKFDASALTYTVTREQDGKVIAKDITDTKCVDDDIDEYLAHNTYIITPSAGGVAGAETKTNTIATGTYGKLPYLETFDADNSVDGYTILSPDNSGRPWFWSETNQAIYDRFNNNSSKNEWLITPKLKLDAKHVYLFSYDYRGGSVGKYLQRMKVTMGKGNTVAAQTNVLADYDNFATDGFVSAKHYVKVDAADDYNFGFYDYSAPGQFYVMVDNIGVKEYTTVDAPDSVTDLKAVAADKGALQTILSFRMPTKAIDGSAVGSLTKAEILDANDKVVKTISNPKPGDAYSETLDSQSGTNAYTVVVYSDKGIGLPATAKTFVGNDVAQAPQNVRAVWGDDDNTAILTWDAPSDRGANGGYVDKSDIKYTVYKYDSDELEYNAIADNLDKPTYTVKESSDNLVNHTYYIAAKNAQGESKYASTSITLGKPYGLKFEENFRGGMNTGPWLTAAFEGSCAWVGDPGIFDIDVPVPSSVEAYFLLRNTTQKPVGGIIYTPSISLSGADHPHFTLLAYHTPKAAKGAYVAVVASANGADYTQLLDFIPLNDNGGWQKHVFDLSQYKDKKVILGIKAYLPDAATRVFVTDPIAENAKGNDLAVAGISAEQIGKAGSKADIKVNVSNLGASDAKDFLIDIVDEDGTVIAEQMPDETLKAGNSASFDFIVPLTAADIKGKKLQAVIDYDDDNADNNSSELIDFAPASTQLPTPTGVAVKDNAAGGKQISWQAPETGKGRSVKNDLEDLRAFTLDNFDGWTTFDGDKELTIGFQTTTNGNDWPNRGAQMAWEVWNPAMAGTEDALLPFSGKNALVSFSASGFYPGAYRAPGQNDDWLISPEILGGSRLAFKGLSLFSSTHGESDLEVLYSTASRDTADFKHLETISLGSKADDEWEDCSVELPADAKYVALRNVGTNYGIMLDDLEYTLAETPQLQGYNVYRDNSQLNNAPQKETSYTDAKAPASATFGVSAVYDLGESDLVVVDGGTSGIADITAGITISLVDGGVKIQGAAGKTINVSTIGGMQVAKVAKAADSEIVKLASGVYVVSVGDANYKLYVK